MYSRSVDMNLTIKSPHIVYQARKTIWLLLCLLQVREDSIEFRAFTEGVAKTTKDYFIVSMLITCLCCHYNVLYIEMVKLITFNVEYSKII